MEQRTFVDFAYQFGFRSVDDRTPCGKSIFHYFFGAVKYCWLAPRNATTAFRPDERKFHGDYKAAMSQQVTEGHPLGVPALHVLCNSSGTEMVVAPVIQHLIDYGIVPLNASKDWRNNDVSVFVSL